MKLIKIKIVTLSNLKICTFTNSNEAFQIYISLIAELHFCEYIDNSILISDCSISLVKELCRESEIEYQLSKSYCLLPFPSEERECLDLDIPRIYVSCLAAYNSGYLHGMWIDATKDPDDIYDDIEWLLTWSPLAIEQEEDCEEWAIHDYENFQNIRISEYENIETVSQLANAIEENGKAFALFYENDGHTYDISEAVDRFEESYRGEYKSQEDFAYELVENCGYMLDENHPLYYYIDFNGYARDLEYNGEFYFIQSGFEEFHVFENY